MASQRPSEQLYTASNFTELVDQVRDVRMQLDSLKIGYPVLEYTIGCLSGETIMMEESLCCFREYIMENKDIARRDPDLVNDINSVLFATSVTLSEILEEASNKGFGSISSRSSRISRLLTSSKAETRKYDGMDSLLQRLLGCSSALRVLYRMIDPFERRGLGQQSLSKYKNSIILKLGMEMARRSGANPPSPNYVRSLWPEHPIAYPLTSELMGCGLSQQQVLDIYQKSNQKSFVVKHALKRWRSYGSEDDYRVALALVARNGYDIEATDQVLTTLLSYGKDLYGGLLKVLQKANYEYRKIMRWLSELLDLVGLSQGEVSTEGSAGEGNIWRPFHNAMAAKDYNFRAISADLAYLRPLNTRRSRKEFITNDGPRSTPMLRLWLWEYYDYDLSDLRLSVKRLQSRAAQSDITWSVEEALLALSDYSFDTLAFGEGLDELDRTEPPMNSQTVSLIIQSNIRRYPMPEISSAVRVMKQKMYHTWRDEGFHLMASQCDYDLDRMLDMQTRLEAAFPASFVERNICWDWLAFNNFDLAITLKDALKIPPGFLYWSSHDKRAYLYKANSQRHHSPSDTSRHLLFER